MNRDAMLKAWSGRKYTYEVEHVEACPCQGATARSFLYSPKNTPCRVDAHIKVNGIALCRFHVGTLLTNGMIPSATGGVWEDTRKEAAP